MPEPPDAPGPHGAPRGRGAGGLVGDRGVAREVLRMRRRAAQAPGPLQVVQDWYVGIFITVTLLTMLFAATGPAILRPDCDTAVCLDRSGHDVVAVGAALLGLLAVAVAVRMVGPASSDPGRAAWMLSTPADRGLLLRGSVLQAGGVLAIAGGAWGVLVGFALASGSAAGRPPAVPVAACAVVGLLVALLLVSLGLVRQGGAVTPARAARAVPDAELAAAGQVVQAVTAATLMLDGMALEVLASGRRAARTGSHHSRPGLGGPLTSVLVHELRGLLRRARPVAAALLACVAALVVGLVLGQLAGAVLAALATFAVVRAAAGGLTVWLTTPGLRRALPAHPVAVATVLAGPPFVLAVVGATIAVSVLGLPWWAPTLLALAATAGAMRACDPPPELGVALSTPGGAVHVGLVQRLVLGTDLALLGAALALIGEALDLGLLTVLAGVALVVWQLARSRD